MKKPGWLALLVSCFAALALTALPLPESLGIARPAFVALICAYFSLQKPQMFGLILAGIMGLLLDAMYATVLGQHMLALVLVSYITLKLRSNLILIPAWQQALALLPIWAVYCGCLYWLDHLVGNNVTLAHRLWPILTTSLCWLPLSLLFSTLGRPRYSH